MKKTILFFFISVSICAQTFTWTTATDPGATVSETLGGVTVTVSNTFPQGGQEINLLDAGSYAGSSGNIVMANVTNISSITFIFTQAINIHDIYALNAGENVSSTWTYTPTGGSNSVVTNNIVGLADGHTVILNWIDVTSFTVTKPEDLSCFAFDVINDPALPVELTSFEAQIINENVCLNWQTATEVNNYGFEVERSQNDNWQKIGFVQGHGNSNSPKEYSFTDQPNGGNEFRYRLKQIDTDGKYEYSSEVEVNLNVHTDFSVKQNFPNPFNPTTKIEFSIPSDNIVEIKVFNVLGMEVATLLNEHRQAGTHSVEFNASNLSSGIYFYKIISGKYSELKKMILLR